MNRTIFFSTLFIMILTTEVAYGEDTKDISALDYALSENSLVGQTLKLTGCRISHMSIRGGLCNITEGNAGVGDIVLKADDNMDKAALKDAITRCAGLKGFQSPECDASIIGTAKPKQAKPVFQLKKIIWSVEK